MDKRAVLAAVLMLGVLMLYFTLFPPAPPEPSAPAQKAVQAPVPAPAPAGAGGRTQPAAVVKTASPREATGSAARPPHTTIAFEGGWFRALGSSDGGKLQELVLRYRGDKAMVAVGERGLLGLQVGPREEVLPMRAVVSTGPPHSGMRLEGDADGVTVRLTMEPTAEFTFALRVEAHNTTREPRALEVALPWMARPAPDGTKETYPGQLPTEVVWKAEGRIGRSASLDVVPEKRFQGEWIGVGSTWYLAALIPKSGGFSLASAPSGKLAEAKNGKRDPIRPALVALKGQTTLPPGGRWEGRALLYVGPKEHDRLVPHGLEGTIDFGGFPLPRAWGGLPMEWLGVPILQLMNWVYGRVGNYGIAIVLITVLSKTLFFPLSVVSMRSMKAMQALQPQINALRSKHRSDNQRLQRETMDLYKRHKVNPLGGCLPMVAQLPVFYALYLALSVSVELQNAPLVCLGEVFGMHVWICDLAAADPTYVLPLLMGVTMFVQQKMTPVVGDPRQAKMMLLMPVVFTFMFLSLPSGLVLYWTVSNVLQIGQQMVMDRSFQRKTQNA